MCVRMAMYIPHTLWYDRGEPAAGQQDKHVISTHVCLNSNQSTFLVAGASNMPRPYTRYITLSAGTLYRAWYYY